MIPTWLSCATLVALMAITAIQDFKSRAISAVLPALIFIIAFLHSYNLIGIELTATITISNIALLSVQFLLLYLYVRIVKKSTDITNTYLGWGDILFLIALSPMLSPFNFILFNLFAFIITVIAYLTYSLINKKINRHIPLAGIVALHMAIFILLCEIKQWYFYAYNDYWLIDFIYSVANG